MVRQAHHERTLGDFEKTLAGRAQAMTTADAGIQTDVAVGCLLVIDGAGDGFAIGDQVSKRFISPTAGGVALCFLLSLSVPTARRAVAGPVAGRLP